MLVVTNSELSLAKDCLRRHHYAYRLGYREHESGLPLRLGTLIHSALEIWWRDRNVDKALHIFEDDWGAEENEKLRAKAMVANYIPRWSFEGIKVIDVERTFCYEAEPGVVFAGKFDALAEINGETWIVEHKTSSDFSETYFKQLTIDSQISFYWMACQEMGLQPAGVLYDVLYKPSLRLSKKETPQEYGERCSQAIEADPKKYYRREHIVRLENEMPLIRSEAMYIVRQIQNKDTIRNSRKCNSWGRPCPYLGVCDGSERLEHLRKIERKHEEL